MPSRRCEAGVDDHALDERRSKLVDAAVLLALDFGRWLRPLDSADDGDGVGDIARFGTALGLADEL